MAWDWQPDLAPALMTWAGTATADHKYADCIPGPAKALIRRLAAPFGALLLAAAITCPAWIFSGSGRFRVISRRPRVRRIADSPLGGPCHRHAAVFARLYQALVWAAARVEATEARHISQSLSRPL